MDIMDAGMGAGTIYYYFTHSLTTTWPHGRSPKRSSVRSRPARTSPLDARAGEEPAGDALGAFTYKSQWLPASGIGLQDGAIGTRLAYLLTTYYTTGTGPYHWRKKMYVSLSPPPPYLPACPPLSRVCVRKCVTTDCSPSCVLDPISVF